MFKKILLALFCVVSVVGGLAGIKGMQIKALIAAGQMAQMPRESVSTAIVTEDEWRDALVAVGTLSSVQGVRVSAEAAGVVHAIHFESGAVVEKGALLVELDTSTEAAQLKAAEAQLKLARIGLNRTRDLRERNALSQSELDTADARFLEAEAQVANLQAVIDKKRIRAPFSGRLGIRAVNLGEFLNAGSPIVSLQSLDPVYVDFSLPQQQVGKVAEGMTVEIELNAYPEETFSGEIAAIAPELDVATRSIMVRAILPNKAGSLRPGMFATVSVLMPRKEAVLVVPSTAILYAPYGDSVYIIADDGNGGKIAKQKFVRVLEKRGDFAAIKAGLEAGDEVVSAGVFKLRNGTGVLINNDLSPDARMNPEPEDA